MPLTEEKKELHIIYKLMTCLEKSRSTYI